jgi:serine/threonine protein kinase/tetratricopeptide (TPR) repeat protein
MVIRAPNQGVMKSSVERDQQVMAILASTLQRPPAEREVYMRMTCKNDEDLYREVAEALEWEDRMGSFLSEPWVEFTQLARPFQAGQIIEDRFEVVREIGEGGMGIVYEAFDRKRNLKIAIKAAKPGFQRLLSPELEGALKVRHHNICLVNQIHTAQTKYGDIDFLTMEFLDGETLSAHLKARGNLPEAEALEIARQLCAGVSEAHRSSVIHRDLKSANVILCRGRNESVRAVITDFGLAGVDTGTSVLAGTPRYIAPELWQGKQASKASDIYALGMILYDMVKGLEAESPVSKEGALQTFPPLPDAITKGLSTRWARTIVHCLDPSPASRPLDATAVLAGLERRRLKLVPLLAVPLLALTTLVSSSVRSWVHDQIWPPPGVRLVVLPPLGSDATAVTSGGVLQDVSDRISHLRSGSHSVAVIPSGKAWDLQVQTPEQAQKVLHATHALQTQTLREGGDILVKGAIVDLETQTHVRDFSYRYSAETVGALAAALAGEVSAGLGLRGTSVVDTLSAVAATPYDHGLYLLQDSQNADEAAISFEEAAHLDPRSPLPLAGLVEAEIKSFENTKDPARLNEAQEHLQTAESLSPDSVSVHLAAGKLHESTGKFEKALEDYLRVKELAPTNVDAFVRTAGVYDKLDMPDKAIREYRKAIELDPTYYEPYEYLGVFYYFRGHYSEAAEQFRKVIERAPGMYRAHMNLAACLENLGRNAEAEQALLTAMKLRTTPDLLNNMGTLLAAQNRDADAVPYYQRAVALNPREYLYLLNLGDSNRRLGHIKAAKEEYRQALQLTRAELEQNPGNGSARASAAYFAARLGERGWAEGEIGQALRSSPADNRIIRWAALTYEALGLRDDTLATLSAATPELLRELDREPDLADLRQDSRFRQLVERILSEGK